MKIRILKDIPGFKEGEIVTGYFKGGDNDDKYIMTAYYRYDRNELIESGIAEEVTDIDIEEIRKNKSVKLREAWNVGYDGAVHTVTTLKCLQQKEIEWFSAYRVVSGVIRQLNGDWNDDDFVATCIYYNKNLGLYSKNSTKKGLLARVKDKDAAQKVIDLCTPELLTLFNIK